MALPLDEYQQRLLDSGLLSAAEVSEFMASLPAERRPQDGSDLAVALVRADKLTEYQSQQVYQGEGRNLVLGNFMGNHEYARRVGLLGPRIQPPLFSSPAGRRVCV